MSLANDRSIHLVWARIVVSTLALELIHFLEPQTWITLSLSLFSGAHKFMCQQLEVKLKCANLIKLQLGACAPIKFEEKKIQHMKAFYTCKPWKLLKIRVAKD